MIEIKFYGTAAEVRNDMVDLLGFGPALNQPTAGEKEGPRSAEAKPARKSTKVEKAEPGPQPETEKLPPEVEATTTTTVDHDSVKALCGKAIDRLGPDTVKQAFAELGAQKFPDVREDQYAALTVRLEDLLSAADAATE